MLITRLFSKIYKKGGIILVEPSGQKIICGIRPEHFEISSENKGIKVEVNVVEPTGADTLLFSKVDEVEFCSIFKERVKLKSGESLCLIAAPENIHIFDFENNKRI